MENVKEIYQPLLKYIPEPAHQGAFQLLKHYPIFLKITKPRKTILGSYKKNINGKDEISINGNLNPYAFLITFLHEYAHLIAYQKYGKRIAPHGEEWKKTFAEVLHPFLHNQSFPKEISNYLISRGANLSASQSTDHQLYQFLKNYDEKEEGVVLLKNLSIGDKFTLSNGMRFEKVKINRTRAVCRKIDRDRRGVFYTVSLLTEVFPIS